MQIQRVQNNNYKPNFRQKIIFDPKLISRATREEKEELAVLKTLFRDNGQRGLIEIKNNKKLSVLDIIDSIYSKYKIDSKKVLLKSIRDTLGI